MKKRDSCRDGIPPVGTGDGARMTVLAAAARIAKPFAAADAAHDCGGQSPADERRALFDVQLDVGADPGWIEQPPPFPDRLRIEALARQRRLESLAVV